MMFIGTETLVTQMMFIGTETLVTRTCYSDFHWHFGILVRDVMCLRTDIGEMGYLHLRVHSLVNLDAGLASNPRPDLTRTLFSAELVTSNYRLALSTSVPPFINTPLDVEATFASSVFHVHLLT